MEIDDLELARGGSIEKYLNCGLYKGLEELLAHLDKFDENNNVYLSDERSRHPYNCRIRTCNVVKQNIKKQEWNDEDKKTALDRVKKSGKVIENLRSKNSFYIH